MLAAGENKATVTNVGPLCEEVKEVEEAAEGEFPPWNAEVFVCLSH